MSSGCGDDHGVGLVEEAGVDHLDLPAGHLAGVVAAFAGAAPIGVAGWSTFTVTRAVINVTDGSAAEPEYGGFGHGAGSGVPANRRNSACSDPHRQLGQSCPYLLSAR